jgi:L-galactono-1,4-lactone dehydrogenase
MVTCTILTIQAGARIADVIEGLRAHDLALQNIASIREQAMGGFVQVRSVASA